MQALIATPVPRPAGPDHRGYEETPAPGRGGLRRAASGQLLLSMLFNHSVSESSLMCSNRKVDR